MLKNKTLITSTILGMILFVSSASGVAAFENKVQIQQLPTYTNTDTFKLSCSALTENLIDGDPTTTSLARFYFTKNGDSEKSFGSAIDLTTSPCQIDVTGAQVTDETTYTFTVKLDSGETSSTTVIFDKSGPDPVSNYYKDGLSDGVRIHWTNPGNSDFSKVIIYRGTTPDFSADSNHEITTQPGGASSPMTYEDHSVAPTGQNYYYVLRAIDKAGNSSGLVGDGGTTTVVNATSTPTNEKVTVFPKEQTGSVLGTETLIPTPSATAKPGIISSINGFASNIPQPFKWIFTHKKISLAIGLVLVGAAYLLFRLNKKK